MCFRGPNTSRVWKPTGKGVQLSAPRPPGRGTLLEARMPGSDGVFKPYMFHAWSQM